MVVYWCMLLIDEGVMFDVEVFIDVDELEFFVIWGMNLG